MITQTILKNNITLITEEIPTVKTVAVGFWFNCGSRYETEGEKGISHFVEHMLFKGTNTKTAFEIAEKFDRIGGYLNAFTERETVCLHCIVPAIHIKTAIEVMSDMIENSSFNEKEIERERKVIISEIISSLDDPEETALDASIQAIYPNNAISHSILATKKDVKALTRTQLVDWYEKFFKNSPMYITIAGNIDTTMATSILENLKERPLESKNEEIFITPEYKNGNHFIKADFQQQQLFSFYPIGTPLLQKNYYSLAILNALIGDTMSSRLFQSLREKSGACYSVYSFVSIYSDCAYWCAYASSEKKRVAKVIANLKKEITLLLQDGFSDDEIIAAKEHICGEEIISSEDMEQRMKFLSRNYSLNFTQTSLEETIAQIRAITKEELSETLQELLNPKNEALLEYGIK